MANENPIKVNKPSVETEFLIPRQYADTMFYLTLKVEILEAGWVYAAAHSIYLDTSNLYPQKTPEPDDLKLNYAHELDGLRFSITSHIACFFEDGDTDKSPTIKYTLMIEAGEVLIEKFLAESRDRQSLRFRSLITFKLEQ